MLTKFTKEQEMLIEDVKNDWLDLFFSLKFDEDKAKECVDFMYALAGKPKPMKFIFDSPLAIQIVANIFKNIVESNCASGSQLDSQLRSQLYSQLYSQLRSQLDSQLDSQLHSQLYSQLHSQLDSQLHSQLHSQLKLSYFWTAWYATYVNYDLMAYFDFASKIGVAKSSLFNDYRELIRANIGALIIQEHYALISRPPVKICRDENNNLHCTTDYAIKFADGYGQHYLWGVYFSPLDFQKYVIDRVSAKELFAVKNQEQKAALIKLYGYEKLLEELPGIRVVDKLEKQGKMHVLYTWTLSRDVHPTFLMVEDFSSDRRYFIGVPGSCGSALDALAWTFNVSSEEYAKLTVEA